MRPSSGASEGGPSAAATPAAPIAAIAAHRIAIPFIPLPFVCQALRILPASAHQLPDAPPPPELPPPPEKPPPDDDDDEPPDVNTMPPTVALPLVFMSSAAFWYHGMCRRTTLAIGYPITYTARSTTVAFGPMMMIGNIA